jgi:uncharacterized LabA/DUF88 family protein
MKTALFIDGENLRNYVKTVLLKAGIKKSDVDLNNLDFKGLFSQVLKGIRLSKKIYYSAKLHQHSDSIKKSKELIQKQRVLKTNLEKQGFEFSIGGNVRAQKIKVNKGYKTIFREKGVDVKIAIDLVISAFDKRFDAVILCSSDSDLQPAVKEARARKLQIIYLGFEINPNKGLIYTTDRTILIRNSEILDYYSQK